MPVPVLVEVVGHMEGRRILLNRDVVLGRVAAPGVTAVPNREVSRRHCAINRTPDGALLIEDLGSANGTWVNGQRAARSLLSPGDRIALGRTVFEVQMEAEEDEVPTIDGAGDREGEDPLVDGGLSIDASASQFGRLPQDLGNLREVARHRDLLHRLCELSRSMATTTDLSALSDQICRATLEMFPTARRSHVVLANGGDLTLLATRSRTHGGSEPVQVHAGELPISRSILARAIRQRESISSVDATLDDRFMGQHSVVINNIRAFMCAPLLFQQEVLGAVLVDTTVGSQGFNEQDLEMLTAVGAQLAVQVKAVQLIAENLRQAEVRAHLSRYLSPDLVEQVLQGKVNLSLGGELREGAVLFSDLVGFTALSERVSPTYLVRLLNQYFSRMVEAVFRQGGSVNKFGGDSMLAVWGLTRSDPEDALAAARAGLAMQNALFAINLETGLDLRMGIGINRGPFIAGNVGSAQQMEYTVLGDTVNLAQRVESQAGPSQVLVSADCYAQVEGDVGGFLLPRVKLKGKRDPVEIYSLRSVLLEPGVWLTSLPIVLRRDGEEPEDGQIVFVQQDDDGLRAHVQTTQPLEADEVVVVELVPPEYPGVHVWTGTVVASEMRPGTTDEGGAVAHTELLFAGGGIPAVLRGMIDPRPDCVPVPRA